MFKTFLVGLYQRLWKSYRSTLLGIAVAAATEMIAYGSTPDVPPWVHMLAGVLTVPFLAWKDQAVKDGTIKLLIALFAFSQMTGCTALTRDLSESPACVGLTLGSAVDEDIAFVIKLSADLNAAGLAAALPAFEAAKGPQQAECIYQLAEAALGHPEVVPDAGSPLASALTMNKTAKTGALQNLQAYRAMKKPSGRNDLIHYIYEGFKLISGEAYAQTGPLASPRSTQPTPVPVQNNYVTMNVSGSYWATARFIFTGTFASQTGEFDYTIDGVNWLPSGQGAPYVKRVDAVSANPSMVFGSTATVGGNSLTFNINTYGASTWELPLAGNVQAVRFIALSTSTAKPVVQIQTGLPYVPGVPVTATMFDNTSAVNTANDTGILNISGWATLGYGGAVPATGSYLGYVVDDAGNSISGAFNGTATIATGTTVYSGWGPGQSGSSGAAVQVPSRVRFYASAVSSLTSRVAIYARR